MTWMRAMCAATGHGGIVGMLRQMPPFSRITCSRCWVTLERVQ